jgi:hypothetical protein
MPLADPPGFRPPQGGDSLLRWVFLCPGVNADLIFPVFADEILPVFIRSLEANGPDA